MFLIFTDHDNPRHHHSLARNCFLSVVVVVVVSNAVVVDIDVSVVAIVSFKMCFNKL